MKRYTLWMAGLAFVAVLFSPVATVGSVMDKTENLSGERLAQIALGGLLYDKWYKELEVKLPKKNHFAYPAGSKKKGGSTWRCKECHGWDYMGKNGAYKSGSHFTGITGVRALAGGSENAVIKSLKGPDHKLGQYMPDSAMRAIAAFLVEGQVEMDQVIDRGSKKAKGNIARGKRVFLTLCARCHGADGKELDFGGKDKHVFMGTVANKNPWETLHKIRAGQPGEEMPSMLAFPLQLQVDVLAYSQTLPRK